jgi:hypothetical protein
MGAGKARLWACAAAAVVGVGLAGCSSSSNVRMSAPADYLKVECGAGTEVLNTHRSCLIKASFNWSEPDGRRHAKTVTIAGGETQTVVPAACARLVSAEFISPVCN